MNNIEIIDKKGYRILRPKEGYVLYKDGEIFEGDVILGVNAAPSAYSTIEDVNYKEIQKAQMLMRFSYHLSTVVTKKRILCLL